LRGLTPPASLRVGYERFLTLAKHEIALTAKLAQYVRDRDLAGIRSLESQLDSKATNQAAEALGLKVCAETG
jgi:hypothetical protein